MLALRYAAVLALVFWVGGLVALGALAAPTTFDVLGTRGAAGRALAGEVFGETIRRFHTGAYICGAVIVASLATRAVLGPRPRRFGIRMAIVVLMISAAVWTGALLIPRMQETPSNPPSTLAENDPRRVEFERLHGLSTSLQLVPVLGGLILLFWELKD